MIHPLWIKIIRDIWGNKTRTLIVVFSIAVGTFAVGMMASSQSVLASNMIDSFMAINPSTARLDIEPFDNDLLQTIERMPEIQAAEGRYRLDVRVQAASGAWRNLQLYAIPDYENITINRVVSESGAWPPPDRALLIERAALGLLGFQEGDTLWIETASGKQRQLPIAGIAHDLHQWPANFGTIAYGYITFNTLEWLGEPRLYNQLYVVAAEQRFDKQHARDISALIRDKRVEKNHLKVFLVNIREPGRHVAYDLVQSMALMLGIIGICSLFLSCFLVINTMSALLTQQVRQIGVMKAMGARQNQLIRAYLSMVLLFSLLALVLSVPTGIFSARIFTEFILNLFNFNLVHFSVPPYAIVIQIGVGLVVPLLAALHPVISGTRITVREAITTQGVNQGQFGSSFLDRLIERVRGLPFLVMLSLRNTFRRKGRLILTLTTLTLGGATFIAVLNVRVSLFQTLDNIMLYWNYDIDVAFDRAYRVERLEQEVLRVPGVVHVESWGSKTAFRIRPDGSENENIAIIAPPANTHLIQPILSEGRWLVPEDDNAIVVNTAFLLEEPDVAVGDDVVLKIEGRETTWRVVGTVTGQLGMMGPFVYMNQHYFARAMQDVGHANYIVIQTERHDAAFQSQVRERLEAHLRSVGLSPRAMNTNAELRLGMEGIFIIFVMVTLVMAFLLALVGGLGLMGLMSLNVMERIREIGVLRAVGASNGSVLQIVMSEGILIGLLSWLMGVMLAFPLGKFMGDAVGIGFLSIPLAFTFTPASALIWLVIVCVLATLASFLPAWHASRITVREVLAYE